ncbi:MAG: hypothetical protein ACOYEV_01515 [Candidatus Nanopelagicales bacterium]
MTTSNFRKPLIAALALVLTAGLSPAQAAGGYYLVGMRNVATISADGRYVMGEGQVADMATLTGKTVSGNGFVIDNPLLVVQQDEVTAQGQPTWLYHTDSGQRVRIDVDVNGNPLTPAWTPAQQCSNCTPAERPGIVASSEGVTKAGNLVAFCANYDSPTVFNLFIKDLVSGTLSKRPQTCGAGGPWPGVSGWAVSPPQISETGKVIHLRGALNAGAGAEEYYYYPDTLVFPVTGTTRIVRGQGSMTRNGKTLFMRVGTHPVGKGDTKGKVGAYNIKTGKIKKLSGKYRIYGTDALIFSAFNQSTRRGRYVMYGDRMWVIDRKTGKKTNLAKILASYGFDPTPAENFLPNWLPKISSNGKVVLVGVGINYVDGGPRELKGLLWR